MFRIVKEDGFYQVEYKQNIKFLWFFVREEWKLYEFDAEYTAIRGGFQICFDGSVQFASYHEALQALLIKIEYELNLAYLDAK